jgi:hypothetical protein
MNLDEIYSKQVKKTAITNLSVGGNMPSIERDPNIVKLEKDVFAKMRSICPPDPKENKPSVLGVKTFSFEDAVKELINLKKIS